MVDNSKEISSVHEHSYTAQQSHLDGCLGEHSLIIAVLHILSRRQPQQQTKEQRS